MLQRSGINRSLLAECTYSKRAVFLSDPTSPCEQRIAVLGLRGTRLADRLSGTCHLLVRGGGFWKCVGRVKRVSEADDDRDKRHHDRDGYQRSG
jgi:hypothetical protein